MRTHITKRLVEAIQSGKQPEVIAARKSGKSIEIRDERQIGFILRVQPSGSMSYICEYARGKRVTLGNARKRTSEWARARAKQVLGVAAAGDDPRPERKRKEHTLKTFIDEEYEPWTSANRKDGVARLNARFAEFFEKKLDEINPWIIEKWRTARMKEGRAPATVNRDLDDMKALLYKAVEWGLLDVHPFAKTVKRLKVDNERMRFLSDAEETNLRSALDAREQALKEERDNANRWRRERAYPEFPSLRDVAFTDHLKPMVLVSINTGLRRGELFQLAWQNVDTAHAIITVKGHTAKSSKTRHIPLNDEALDALKAWHAQQADTSGLVFPSIGGKPFDNVQTSWEKLLADARITDFHWHDLRHHFASRLVMAGVDLNTVRELLGHADIKMTLRYAHLAPEHKAAAVARLVRRHGGAEVLSIASKNV
jgi:integrase